jgi:signal transduction histidine kinase
LEFSSKEGLPEGALVDLWKEWAAKTNTKVKLVTVPDDSALPLLEEGTVDIIANAGNTPELYYSDSYFTHNYFLFSLKGLHLKTAEQFPLRIGIIAKDKAFIAPALPPSSQITFYPTYQRMLTDLLLGKVDYFIANDTNLNFSIKGQELLKLYYPKKPFYQHHVRAGTLQQRSHLLGDINAGMQAITNYERQAIVNEWSPSMVGYRFSWEIIGLSAAVLLFIIISIAIWLMNIKLKVQVAEQTYRLEAQKRELESDIQRRQLLEGELQHAKILADTANKAKSQFLSNMTHELRTPLRGVLGMNELLARTPLSEQQQQLVETVQNSGQDLLLTINNILDFSKIESGNLPLDNVEFDLHKVIEGELQLLSESAQDKGLNLSGRIDFKALWRVKADPVKLRHILVNLISNAIKFTLQGDILVEVTLEETSNNHGYFQFTIQDTGIGMNQEDLNRVFSAFTQVDSSQERKFPGSGLGLAIVRQLVDLMGGEISIESQLHQGSCFKVRLPFELIEQQQPEVPDFLKNSRVLLQVEHPFTRETLQQMLSVFGCQVYPVATGEEAWNRLVTVNDKSNSFDIALIEAKSSVSDGDLLSEKNQSGGNSKEIISYRNLPSLVFVSI